MADKISETAFASQVESLLNLCHWQWIHIRPARVLRRGKEIYETPYSGHKGFLDYLALRPPRIVVAELKSEDGEMTPEQQEWFDLWKQCQRIITSEPLIVRGQKVTLNLQGVRLLYLPEIYLWWPSQFDEIVGILK